MNSTRREFVCGATAFALIQGVGAAGKPNKPIKALYENGSRASDFLSCRRLYLDICGRIPTPEEVTEYVASKKSRKYEDLINKLLKSKNYTNY